MLASTREPYPLGIEAVAAVSLRAQSSRSTKGRPLASCANGLRVGECVDEKFDFVLLTATLYDRQRDGSLVGHQSIAKCTLIVKRRLNVMENEQRRKVGLARKTPLNGSPGRVG